VSDASVEQAHLDVFAGGNAQRQTRLERQREKDVVVVADDPPEPGVTQIAVRQQIQTVALDHGVQAVVVSGDGVDALAHAEGGAVAVLAFRVQK